MIETERLARRFGNRLAVDELTIGVDAGEILGLLGPNGAGKTTTIRMLAGIIAPTSGTARVDGLDPAIEPERVHERIGLLTESPGFYERLSAKRNLEYFARFYAGIEPSDAAERALVRMGLADRADDRVATFSKGMKQRLALARTLIHEPRILFLDEPTAGLDPEAARDLRDLIQELRRDRRTTVLCTHNLQEAEALCDRVAIFRTRLVAMGSPAELRERQCEPTLRLRLRDASADLLASIDRTPFVRSVERVAGEPGGIRVRLDDPEADRRRLVAMIVEAEDEIIEMVSERPSLEAVYLRLIREEPS